MKKKKLQKLNVQENIFFTNLASPNGLKIVQIVQFAGINYEKIEFIFRKLYKNLSLLIRIILKYLNYIILKISKYIKI